MVLMRRAALLLALVCAAPAAASAQEQRWDPGLVRSGFVFSLMGGWGTYTARACDGCEAGYFASCMGIHAGGMIGTRMALLGGLDFALQEGRLWSDLNLISRWFLSDGMWGDVGVGAAYLDIVEPGEEHGFAWDGYSLHLAAGYDLVETRQFAIEASVRMVVAHTATRGASDRERNDAAVSAQVGFTWY
jgi:hypothetical protein